MMLSSTYKVSSVYDMSSAELPSSGGPVFPIVWAPDADYFWFCTAVVTSKSLGRGDGCLLNLSKPTDHGLSRRVAGSDVALAIVSHWPVMEEMLFRVSAPLRVLSPLARRKV